MSDVDGPPSVLQVRTGPVSIPSIHCLGSIATDGVCAISLLSRCVSACGVLRHRVAPDQQVHQLLDTRHG